MKLIIIIMLTFLGWVIIHLNNGAASSKTHYVKPNYGSFVNNIDVLCQQHLIKLKFEGKN